jgi:hypothetical protein
MFKKALFALLLLVIITGCASYYQKQEKFQNLFTTGRFEEADKLLNEKSKSAQGINRVLFYFNKGVNQFMLGNYQESNRFFHQADLYIEDYVSNIGLAALSMITNPMVKPYRPEDFESVMIHYYKALNYLFLTDYEAAIVECRRLNIQLQRINDKHAKVKNKYSRDAFAMNLMGMIYEAAGDPNNAFIAYRNALEVYENDYKELFGMEVPQQLKADLIRTANLTGFYQEQDFYEKRFGLQHQPVNREYGTLVFFWMNGMGPVKDQWSINFASAGYNNGWLTLANEEYGLTYPIYVGKVNSGGDGKFSDLSLLRVAFPKYVERKPYYYNANVIASDTLTVGLELGENINAIAFQCLKDRMAREVVNSLTRLATKKVMESVVRHENDNLGTLLSIVNAATESADTRNWQLLPYSISYARISLPPGKHRIQLNAMGNDTHQVDYEVEIKPGKSSFLSFHHLGTAK